MLSEWSAECGPEDAVLVVPWHSPDGKLRWIDLRDDADALEEIVEADEHPALLAALRVLNGQRSPVFTAKCDVWPMDAEELFAVREELMLEPEVAMAGVACYIDTVWRERTIFLSRHRMEGMLYRLDRAAADLPFSMAKLECTMRPAVVDLDGSVAEGFAVSVYVKAVGVDEREAAERWDDALRAVAMLVRSRDFATT